MQMDGGGRRAGGERRARPAKPDRGQKTSNLGDSNVYPIKACNLGISKSCLDQVYVLVFQSP